MTTNTFAFDRSPMTSGSGEPFSLIQDPVDLERTASKLKEDLPLSSYVYNSLLMHARQYTSKYEYYVLKDKPDSHMVLWKNKTDQMAVGIHCLESEVPLLENSLRNTSVIDFKKSLCFFHVPDYFLQVLQNLAKEAQGQEMMASPANDFTVNSSLHPQTSHTAMPMHPTPHALATNTAPYTQGTHTAPYPQAAHTAPFTQATHTAPNVQATHTAPHTQATHTAPHTQATHIAPHTQATTTDLHAKDTPFATTPHAKGTPHAPGTPHTQTTIHTETTLHTQTTIHTEGPTPHPKGTPHTLGTPRTSFTQASPTKASPTPKTSHLSESTQPSQSFTCPAGFRVYRMGKAGVQHMHSSWRYKASVPVEDILELSKNVPTAAVYEEPEQTEEYIVDTNNIPTASDEKIPVSWVSANTHGPMGMQMTEESHRGRGFAKLLSNVCAKMMESDGFFPHATVEEDIPSLGNFYQQLPGWSHSRRVTWLWQTVTEEEKIMKKDP